jgi:TatD DNase family protein
MIDCHCHLEQKQYQENREKIIQEAKKELKALVTCAAHPKNIKLTIELTKKHKNFIFAALGIHPTYIKEITEQEIEKAIEEIKENKNNIVAIGETGLDYHWIKEPGWQEKQKILFRKLIALAKELNLPLIIHSRNATPETIEILEQEDMKEKKVLMHLFGDKKYIQKIINNNWFVSIGPGIRKSKDIRKIARDMPLKRILLETDSPWFAQEGQEYGTPNNVKIAAEKIAEIKKISIGEVEKQTDLNAKTFFDLKIK